MRRPAILLLSVGLAAIGPAAQEAADDALWHHRNLGKAFYENPTTQHQAVDEFRKALDLAPDSARERVNYGLALLRAGRVDEGAAELERAQQQDPSIPHTWFNLGIVFKKASEWDKAIAQFEQMVVLVPDEAISRYNLGYLYRLNERSEEALRQFELAAELDPNLAAPHFQLYNMYRERGRTEEAAREQQIFQAIRKRQTGSAIPEDLDWSFYAEILDPADATTAIDDTPPAPLRFQERPVSLGPAPEEPPGLIAIDVDKDGRTDLITWSNEGVRLYRRGETLATDAGLEGLKAVLGVAAGDFDNDGFPDLCVLTDAGPLLFRNVDGRFEPSGIAMPSGRFTVAIWIDYDHDYDMDLLLLGPAQVLLRNNGEAGFSDETASFPFVDGQATSGHVFDLVADTVNRDIFVTYADRPAVLYRDQLAGRYEALPVEEAPAGSRVLGVGDVDYDGFTDILLGVAEGVTVLFNRVTRFEPVAIPGSDGRAAALADFENRAVADVVSGGRVIRNLGEGRFAPLDGAPLGEPPVALVTADFDGDGRVDVAAIRSDGSLRVLRNETETSHGWIGVRLTGVRNMQLAPMAQVEVKAGRHFQKQTYTGVPLHFGLRGRTQVDTVRITWPNGLVQNEIRQPGGETAHYRELPRLSGSCPMVFTWNGHEFQFITDVLGVAPLGASAGDGTFFPADHDEYIQIPGEALALRDGEYEIRITEELREIAYLDQIQLIAVDHPSEIDIFTNDKFKAPPFPEFRLFGVSERIDPLRARDHRGRDVRPALLALDRTYADGFARDFRGLAEDHFVELDFGRAAPDNRAVLILNGWVDWPDPSTFLGRAQEEPEGIVFPMLQVKNADGQWQTVIEDMGMPAGKPKTIAVDLTGRFLSDSREVRILTNLSLYWDEIFLGESPDPPPAVLTRMDPSIAELRFRGFSTPEVHPERLQPETFDYQRPLPLSDAMWNPTPGMYTRFGDVRELLLEIDDRFVIMGAGDELRLTFSADGLPPLPEGWSRNFLLFVDGWAKDGDANTAFSQTVEPLPFHGMSVYPYPPDEQYPDTELHRQYREEYNTRPALMLVRPLRPLTTYAGDVPR
jgi:tetratricopeptide (TPR) repeat protein